MLPGGRAASTLPGGLAGGEGLGLAPPASGGFGGLQWGQAEVGLWSMPGGGMPSCCPTVGTASLRAQ